MCDKSRQIGAWSRRLLRRLPGEREEGEYRVEEEHRQLFTTMFLPEVDGVDVAGSLEAVRGVSAPLLLSHSPSPLCCTMCKIVAALGLQGRSAHFVF